MSKKILITGASSGFGLLTVHQLLQDGHKVAASMRGVNDKNKEAAENLKELGVSVIELDVTDDESVNKGVRDSIDALGGLDIVINNAGIGVVGMQEHFTIDDFKKVMDVNVYGVQRVNRAVLPYLRSQGSGLIIYISSLLGRMTLPFYGPYNASKWALEALAENYRVELAAFGIENVIVEPGGFDTNFVGNLLTPGDNSQVDSYGDFMNVPLQMGQSFGEAVANNPEQRPEKVADAISEVIGMDNGSRPFRRVVDHMGMGDFIGNYNNELEQLMKGVYGNFQMSDMLSRNS